MCTENLNADIMVVKSAEIAVRKPDSAVHLAPQHDQLISERRILGFKPALRLEWRGQNGQHET